MMHFVCYFLIQNLQKRRSSARDFKRLNGQRAAYHPDLTSVLGNRTVGVGLAAVMRPTVIAR